MEATRLRPDFHASFLWKKLIGTSVFAQPAVTGPNRRLRAWCLGGKEGGRWLLLVNLNRLQAASVSWGLPSPRCLILEPEYGARSARMKLNGVLVDSTLEEAWGTPALEAHYKLAPRARGTETRSLELAPLACAFVEVP